ncbi:hypothetical protein NHQ30_008199 [Ciborinia camelliae]|nr:hypothetical protein NHQ30_008199 [Ciborinia camelliae]
MNTFALGAVVIWAIFCSGMGHYETELTHTELQNALKVIPAAYVTWTLGTAATIGIMIWRIHDLITTAGGDFVFHMPTLALTTTLELWLCIIIACIPTLAPILKTYIMPIVTKLSGSRSSAGVRSTPLSIVTFGRLGGRKRNNYTTMTYGSQDPISENAGAGIAKPRETFRKDAFTTTHVTSEPQQKDVELGEMPVENAIHVQQDIDTQSSQ